MARLTELISYGLLNTGAFVDAYPHGLDREEMLQALVFRN